MLPGATTRSRSVRSRRSRSWTRSPPQKPWVKLAELRARHRDQHDWREVLVDDGRLTGEYVSAAPGAKVRLSREPVTATACV